ncbi:MAG: hypothetical protein HYV03_08695, partial [Deltaproteobacteria bacterium]|nr:hypothetical protein [Deltaproteobacteria bacterium]
MAIVVGIALCGVAVSVHAAPFTAFGPEDFVRTTGAPNQYERTFSLLDPSAPYTLHVLNGGAQDQAGRIAAAIITLNGTPIFGVDDFNAKVRTLEQAITPKADNILAVELRSQPAGTLTITVIGEDVVAPTITATLNPLPNAAGWNNSDVTVTFQATDATSGVAEVMDPVVVSGEGAGQVVQGFAVDRAGNVGTLDVIVNLDMTPPGLAAQVDPVPNAAGWNNKDVLVLFRAEDALSGVADVTPAVVPVVTEGAGQVLISKATDIAGNQTTAQVTVNLDKTAPVVAMVSPAPGTKFHKPNQTVQGTASDANSITGVACNSAPATFDGANFSCELTLVKGDNPIVVAATDIAGNVGESQTLVTFIPFSPPVVTIVEPKPLALFRKGPLTVTGTVTPFAEDDPVTGVKVGGVAAQLADNYFTAEGVPLHEGNNILTAVASDQSGDVGTATVAVIQDSTPPTVRIELPAEGTVLSEREVTVAGLINDLVSGTVNADQATVTVNGKPATVANRSFVVPNLPLKPGPNTLVAVATDRAGNQNTHAVTL